MDHIPPISVSFWKNGSFIILLLDKFNLNLFFANNPNFLKKSPIFLFENCALLLRTQCENFFLCNNRASQFGNQVCWQTPGSNHGWVHHLTEPFDPFDHPNAYQGFETRIGVKHRCHEGVVGRDRRMGIFRSFGESPTRVYIRALSY